MFVQIESIDDVLPHLPQDVGFVVSDRPGYKVIDYVYTTDDTFPNAYALECRGIKFDSNGKLIARPFHKFFNIGERQQPNELDWGVPHVVLDKLDGSMIHPAIVDGDLVFMTRKGITPHAEAALGQADAGVLALCRKMVETGLTPIFELTGPENRVVIPYESAALTLLGIREMTTGAYLGHDALAEEAQRFGIPLVGSFGTVDDPRAFVEAGRALEGVEGYVIAFEDGHRVKLKADAYVLRHKALGGVAYEKNLLAWIVSDAIDDVVPLLADDVAVRVRGYRDAVLSQVDARLADVEAVFQANRHLPRRDYAAVVKKSLDPRLQAAAFALMDGKDGRAAIMKILQWASGSETRLDTVRSLFGMAWDGRDLEVEVS